MRIHRSLLAIVVASLGLCTATGCLTLNQKRHTAFPFSPSATAWGTAAFFTAGGGVHGLGSAWFLWPMPVSPALTQEIEELIDRWKRDGVPILGPIKGEFAPVFCMDQPSEKEIYETIPPIPHGVPMIYEKQRKNVRFSTEKFVDKIDECRFFPLAGPCQLHHCHFKCTIWWDETVTMAWPIPWTYTEHRQEVVYIDKDHLHRCGEPGNLTGPGGSMESYGGYAPQPVSQASAESATCRHGLPADSCGKCGSSLRRALRELF